MSCPLPPLFALAIDPTWIIPFMGGVGFVVALLLGRQLLSNKAALDEDEQDKPLDANFLKGVTQDRRAMPRRKGNIVEVLLSDGTENPPVRGLVVDRSQGGIRLQLDVAVTEGSRLKVRPTATGTSAMWAEVTVRSCQREGGQYEVGCQFQQMPNWAQLLQFG